MNKNRIPRELVLETSRVKLRPLDERDFDALLSLATKDDSMWDYFTFNLSNPDHLRSWMNAAFHEMASDTRIAFAIIDKINGDIAGSTSIGNISFHDLRLEIGWSWLGRDYRSTGLNFHAKYALMNFAFEELAFERVEFKTDVLNERAKQGLRKIGAVEEGVLRSHMTMWNNRRRSSVYFSVIKNEWPLLKESIFKEMK